MTDFYLPILKSKLGEFRALSLLSPELKDRIVPFFEITPMEWDHAFQAKPKTIKEHLENFSAKIFKFWPRDNAFIGTHLIMDKKIDGQPCIEYLYHHLAQRNICPIPIVQLASSEEFLDSILKLKKYFRFSEIGLRITLDDISSEFLQENIDNLLIKLECEAEFVHLIFDLADSDFSKIEEFSDVIVSVLEVFPLILKWRSFSLCGAAFPPTNLIKSGNNEVPRNDWNVYKLVVAKVSNRIEELTINFGDYGIVSAGYIEFDPVKMTRSANIRYTSSEIWIVIKGKKLKVSKDFLQYYDQCNEIVNSDYYLGSSYSAGDAHLLLCANRETTPGSPNVWNWVGNNHHFAKVLRDLFSSSDGF
jgi:hypothetical protein